jgi:hypothetical protein
MLRRAGIFRLRSRQESEMTNQDAGAPTPNEAPRRETHRLSIGLALAIGLTGGLLTAAFGYLTG